VDEDRNSKLIIMITVVCSIYYCG
jgi:hypothetical protein